MVNLKTRNIEGYVREAEQRIKQQVKLPEITSSSSADSSRTCRRRARGSWWSARDPGADFRVVFMSFSSVRRR